jgi:RNA polymerase sigma factor (TIGR02999 family)
MLPVVYEELHRMAAHYLSREATGHTLQPTALVHEAWLRVAGDEGQAQFQNRAHFFGATAEAMRRILVDRARRRKALRHGGELQRIPLDEIEISAPGDDDELLALNEALAKLADLDPIKAKLVKLRYFAGLSFEDTAETLGVSIPTAKRWWAFARAWLLAEMGSASK